MPFTAAWPSGANRSRHGNQGPSLPALDPLLATLDHHLTELHASIGQAFPPAAAGMAVETHTLDLGRLREIFRNLAQLLDSRDVQAGSLVEKHSELVVKGLGTAFSLLQQQVQDFEYAQASATLRIAARTAQMKLD